MLFFVKQVHTPENCPARLDKGPDALFDADAPGVNVRYGVADVPGHTLYFLVETDDVTSLHA
ncbi:MAG TPA: hypothetical protein VFK89_00330, partial [Actinomycetota bacterium]|nr:hypothetical protein [Actinomycetota bacterium]